MWNISIVLIWLGRGIQIPWPGHGKHSFNFQLPIPRKKPTRQKRQWSTEYVWNDVRRFPFCVSAIWWIDWLIENVWAPVLIGKSGIVALSCGRNCRRHCCFVLFWCYSLLAFRFTIRSGADLIKRDDSTGYIEQVWWWCWCQQVEKPRQGGSFQ